MGNISAKTMQGWYKNFLLLNNSTNVGVSSTPVSVQDGNGGNLPFKVGTTKLQMADGKYIYFKDNNYIYNAGEDKLAVKAASIALRGAVSFSGKFTGVSGYLVSETIASMIRTKHLKSSGTASMATVSATTLKGTDVKVTGMVSCASLKATLDLTGLTGKSVKLGTMPIYLYGATTIIKSDSAGIKYQFAGLGGAVGLRMTATQIAPVHSTMDLGKAASAFKTIYGVTGTLTTANITTANITYGTFTTIGAIGASKLTVSTASIKRVLKLNGKPLYFDSGLRFNASYVPSVSAIGIGTPASKIYIKSDNTIYPSTTNAVDLGLTAKRWKNIYTTNVSITTDLDVGGAIAVDNNVAIGGELTIKSTTTASGAVNVSGNIETNASMVFKYLHCNGTLPSSSTSVSIGGVYEIASVLMIRKT